MTAKTVPHPSAQISCISTDRQTFDFTIKVQLPNACSICEELFTDEKQLGPNRECKFLSQLCSERKNHRVLAPLIENNEEQQQRQQKSERETQLSDLEVLELFLAGSNMQCYRRVCCGCFENVLLQHANKSGSFWLNDDADIVFSCPFCPLAPVVYEENAEMRLFLAQHPLARLFGNERAKEFFQRSRASKTAKEKAENEENAKENDCPRPVLCLPRPPVMASIAGDRPCS